MNNLLLFFAFPIATIILSIVIEKILKNEFLTAASFFSIYLVLTFSAFDINFLIYAIAYTIISYITALITNIVLNRIEKNNNNYLTYENSKISDVIENNIASNNYNLNNKSGICNNQNYKYFCRK